MNTTALRKGWLRYRWAMILIYIGLLGLSTLIQTPPSFRSLDQASSDPMGILVLVDPLAESTEALISFAEESIVKGRAVRVPELPNLNLPAQQNTSFHQLAETLPASDKPEVIVANGQAGAVSLYLASQRPEQVASLVLVDASGVQEFALLGERHLNKVLYWTGGIGLALVDHLVPHFGLMPDLPLLRSQLRLLRHSDRRHLRPEIERIQQPVLLLQTDMSSFAHSRDQEHTRLLPQSTLKKVPLPHLHEALMMFPELHRAEANLVRRLEAQESFNPENRPRLMGGRLFLTLIAIALATLISEDATCAVTGVMIANGNLTFAQGVGACLTGILLGDYLLFLAGRVWGRPALTKIPLRWIIDPLRVRETEETFARHAEKAILISRCVPGTRLPTYVAAGLLGVPPRVFTFWFVLGGLLWTPAFVGFAMILSDQAFEWIERYHHAAPGLLIGGLLIYYGFMHIALPATHWRGRRHLVGRWRRLSHAEYWPSFLLYTPVILHLLARSLRKGNRLLDFTACNPCMPLSGVVEESKSAILDQVGNQEAVAPYVLLCASDSDAQRDSAVENFLRQHPPAFPVVVKPDRGQRGTDVMIVHTREQLEEIDLSSQDWILQQYIPGEEYGVFVILPPGEEGFIFGINGKRFTNVVADGVRTLKDLLLADDRAVCQTPTLFKAHADHLLEIPPKGERIPLTEVGNHSRGTEFVECSDLNTPELARSIVSLTESLPGFTFGRMDLRVPCQEDFQAGQKLKILEINGVVSESTNLYDSRYSYFQMVRILLKQWAWAHCIGKTSRQQGNEPATLRELFRAFDQYHQRKIHPPS